MMSKILSIFFVSPKVTNIPISALCLLLCVDANGNTTESEFLAYWLA